MRPEVQEITRAEWAIEVLRYLNPDQFTGTANDIHVPGKIIIKVQREKHGCCRILKYFLRVL